MGIFINAYKRTDSGYESIPDSAFSCTYSTWSDLRDAVLDAAYASDFISADEFNAVEEILDGRYTEYTSEEFVPDFSRALGTLSEKIKENLTYFLLRDDEIEFMYGLVDDFANTVRKAAENHGVLRFS